MFTYKERPGVKQHNVIIGYAHTRPFLEKGTSPCLAFTSILIQALACFAGLVEEELSPEDKKQLNVSRMPLYNNLAFCCLKLNEITKAVECCQKVSLARASINDTEFLI